MGVVASSVAEAAGVSRSATARNLAAVDLVDATHGWAVGERVILKTTNGGRKWTVVMRSPGVLLNGVDFVSRTTGWAVGRGDRRVGGGSRAAGLIMKTINGWAVGPDDQLIRTTDGGRTWKGWTDATSRVSYYAVDASSPTAVWAGGYDSSGYYWGFSKLVRSVDGGRTYAECPNSRFSARAVTGLSTVRDAATGVTRIWASCTFVGWVLASPDGGESWQIQAAPNGISLNDIVVRKSLTGYAAGYEHAPPHRGVVLKTVDGRNWMDVGFRPPESLTGVYFVSDSRGWVVGKRGAIYRTTDGGATWQRQ